MKQYEEIIKIMKDNGGFSTLSQLYQKANISNWKTKTPFASIRRIVQDNRYFFKIKPGLWALVSCKDKVISNFAISSNNPNVSEFNHTYYQGLLVDIGNLEGYNTYIPAQDKNKKYLLKPLLEYSSLNELYQFTYEKVLGKVKTIDVSWFNERKYPYSFFEVEHSTDIQNSLLKYIELQDFNVKFHIVADEVRRKEFNGKINLNAFSSIKDRVKFLNYDELSNYHSKITEIAIAKKTFYQL